MASRQDTHDVEQPVTPASHLERAIRRADLLLTATIVIGSLIEWFTREGSPLFLSILFRALSEHGIPTAIAFLEKHMKDMTIGDAAALGITASYIYRQIMDGGTIATLALGPEKNIELQKLLKSQQAGTIAGVVSEIVRPTAWNTLFVGISAAELAFLRAGEFQVVEYSSMIVVVALLFYALAKQIHEMKQVPVAKS